MATVMQAAVQMMSSAAASVVVVVAVVVAVVGRLPLVLAEVVGIVLVQPITENKSKS